MRPVTGARFTWQSNTFMNTEMRVMGSGGRSSSAGGTAVVIRFTRPSAGENTRPSRTGVTPGGAPEKEPTPHGTMGATPPSGGQNQGRPSVAENAARVTG